jgi:hypothetical protein
LSSSAYLNLSHNSLESSLDIRDTVSIRFSPQRKSPPKKIQMKLKDEVTCLISHEPIESGCEYRKCSNQSVPHYYLHEHWNCWDKDGNKKCVLNDGCEIINKIFIA